MDPNGFLNALQDSMPPGNSLATLIGDWQSRMTAAIDEISPRRPLRPHLKRAPWYTMELRERKRAVRRLERRWRKFRDEMTRSSYRTLMKAYEMATKAAKREFFAAEIASASSRPAQLFRVVWSLTTLQGERQNNSQLELGCEALASFFADKILSIRRDLPATVATERELEAPWPSCEQVFDGFR